MTLATPPLRLPIPVTYHYPEPARRVSIKNYTYIGTLHLPPTLRNPIMLYSILKQRANMMVPGPDPKALFSKAKVGKFIKSFDKALPGKTHKDYLQRTKQEKESAD